MKDHWVSVYNSYFQSFVLSFATVIEWNNLHYSKNNKHIYSSVLPSLKVETWLRLKGIPYENIYTLRFGRKGQIPYIELNGEQIPDSNVIIKRLAQHFNVKPDESFNPEQGALGHAVVRMIENHTCKGESDFFDT